MLLHMINKQLALEKREPITLCDTMELEFFCAGDWPNLVEVVSKCLGVQSSIFTHID